MRNPELIPHVKMSGSEAILHGEFGGIHSSNTSQNLSSGTSGPRYALTLTPKELHIQRLVPRPQDDRRTVVNTTDVVGCHVMRPKSTKTSGASETQIPAVFSIYSYPLKKKRMGAGRVRTRVVRTFKVDVSDTTSENRAVAEKWSIAIKCLLRGVSLSGLTEITSSLLPRPQRLLLLVNPFSGRGQAMQLCHTHILPMIREANIHYNLIQTERQNHARDLMREITVHEWDGIVIVSGDGLLHEVINGLMQRPDWQEAIRIPLGVLPCGSGNALAGALNHHAGFEMCLREALLMNCCFLLCRGSPSPMDIVSVTMTSPEAEQLKTKNHQEKRSKPAAGSQQRLFSFLSVAWGFVSDVDIESERYRGLGSARFTLGTLVRLASLRSYKGRLSYLPQAVASLSITRPLQPQLPPRRPLSRSITEGLGGFSRTLLHRTVSDMGLSEERSLMKRNTLSILPVTPDDTEGVAPETGVGVFQKTPSTLKSVMSQETIETASSAHRISEKGESSTLPKSISNHSEKLLNLDGGPKLNAPDSMDSLISTPGLSSPSQDSGCCTPNLLSPSCSTAPPVPGPSPSSSKNHLSTAFTFDLSGSRGFEPLENINGAENMESIQKQCRENQTCTNNFTIFGPSDYLLPPLDQPLPKNWVTHEGEFVLVLAMYQSHLGADLFAAPQAHFNDGTIHLSFVRAGISRGAMLRLFLAMERGTHLEMDSPYVTHIQTRAFRLEPLSQKGTLTVDGELVPYGPLQAQVHPGMARLIMGDHAVKVTRF
ncbi:sphingosine kinase 2 [Erpetoichthys calabaricus]|nr:sphingosine kinase 2 [Erpetoichthys calabaricus]XP_051776120.1 sphingosine kinase 2 [Erpetoichthys calabaricus]